MNFWQRWAKPHTVDPGALYHAPEYRIVDGVEYRQPIPRRVLRDIGYSETGLKEAAKDYNFTFDAPRSSLDGMPSIPTEDPLAEWDYTTRKAVLESSHAVYHRNPLAKRAVDLTRQFVVGKGHTAACANRDVQKVIDQFRDNPENAIHDYDRTFIQDLQVDGEIFIRFFKDNGQVVIAPIPPWHIRAIRSERGFFRRVQAYNLYYTTTDPNDPNAQAETVDEWIPAADMLHVAINKHSYELRGRPDLYVILPWLKAYKDWIEDRARQNKWRGTLLWWVKIAGAAPGMVAAKLAQWKKPPTSGSAYVSSDKEEVQPLTNNVAANDASEDGRQIRMMNVIGVGLAEYMLGDGENANLATASAQQLPALWKFTDGQELMAEQVWRPIYRRVILAAVEAGNLPAIVEQQDTDGDPLEDHDPIPAEQAIEVQYYDLQAPDPKTLGEALGGMLGNRLVSEEGARSVAAPSVGLDPVKEAKRLKAEDVERPPITARNIDMDANGNPLPPEPGQDEEDQPEGDMPPDRVTNARQA